MIRQFIFNGQESAEIGIIVTKIHRPILPALRPRKLLISGKDGLWDFGNNTYEEGQIVVDCVLIEPLSKRNLIRSLALWLSTKGKISFSDEYDKYYLGRLYESFTEVIDGSFGSFSLVFEVDPFAYSALKTTEEVLLSSEIPLGANIMLGNSEEYNIFLNTPGSFSFSNFGEQNIRPKINITGSFGQITLATNSKSLTFDSAITNQSLVLDGENYTAELDGINRLANLTGDIDDFLTLIPGENVVTVSGVNLDCNIEFEFRPTFY